MNNHTNTSWGQRALRHARILTESTPGRGSATRLETQAAVYVHTQLREMGYDVQQQPFIGLRSIWFFLSLVFGLAMLGHLAGAFLASTLGDWPAWGVRALLFGFAFYLMWRKFAFQPVPLRASLPQGSSLNVIAVAPAAQAPRRRVVINAHLDSHRAVIWFASDILVQIYAFCTPLAIYGLLAAPLLYALRLWSGLPVFSWLGSALGVLHFLVWFTGLTADLGAYSPGANDNASSLGVLLTLAERLRHEPLPETEVWLVATGCEETGCDGMVTFLNHHAEALQDAFFIDLEVTGIGDQMAYVAAEGVVQAQRIAPDLAAYLQSLDVRPLSLAHIGAYTEMGVVWRRGLSGACLMSKPSDTHLIPEWHRLTDTPDKLQPEALQRIHDLVWRILQAPPENA
ncbi:MAG: M28 family peptidase [Anaerolineae bacterium]|nr:MAG: M28 family peptidase [Anaerolineae bacterium]